MVYSDKFVFVVLVNGTPVDALANGELHLPFVQEFSLRFRNKNDRRAVVKFTIDGDESVCAPNGYIVEANDYIDIHRHYKKDAAFVVADLESPAAVDAGKNGPNYNKVKGTVVAHFWLEKEEPKTIVKEIHHHHDHYIPKPYPVYPRPWYERSPYYYLNSNHYDDSPSVTLSGSNSASYSCSNETKSSSYADLAKGGVVHDSTPDKKIKRRSRSGPGGSSCSLMSLDSGSNTLGFTAAPAAAMESLNREVVSDLRDACITEGKTTGQKFGSAYINPESTCTTLRIHIKGYDAVATPNAAAPATPPSPYRKGHEPKNKLSELEAENQRLREELARKENEELKKKLAPAKKPKGTRTRTKKK